MSVDKTEKTVKKIGNLTQYSINYDKIFLQFMILLIKKNHKLGCVAAMRKLLLPFILFFTLFAFTGPAEADGSQLVIINKKTNTLAYYNGGTLVKTFKVATGRARSLTPEGKFRIVNKIKNRPYYKENIPGGDPRNPLGDRWMGLEARGTYGTTYAIHGNANENSIGRYVSAGCVRMHNAEVRWLFDQIQMYTEVVITHTDAGFDAIAAANGYVVTAPASADAGNGITPVLDGWLDVNGKKFYYDKGTAKIGWQIIGGKWYFFDRSGIMKTGWLEESSGKFFLDKNGAMVTGWLNLNGSKYYFDGNGVMKTGWLDVGGQRYFLDQGGKAKVGWHVENKQWYYFDSAGVMKTGWLEDAGHKYYLDPNGAMQIGWLWENGIRYYFDPAAGNMITGWLNEAGRRYFFDGAGEMKTGWLNDNSTWRYLDDTGAMVTGWINYKGKWYYTDSAGALQTTTSSLISNQDYFENPDQPKTGLLDRGGIKYNFSLAKPVETSLVKYNNNWYYMYVGADLDLVGNL
jgi:glucan-binding YG repeat protein